MFCHAPISYGYLIFVLLLAGCDLLGGDGDEAAAVQAFEIHLGSEFQGDQVQVAVDGATVLFKRVSTNPLIGLAEIVKVEKQRGTHRILVRVNQSHVSNEEFQLDGELYISVGFRRRPIPELGLSQGIDIQYGHVRPMYD